MRNANSMNKNMSNENSNTLLILSFIDILVTLGNTLLF